MSKMTWLSQELSSTLFIWITIKDYFSSIFETYFSVDFQNMRWATNRIPWTFWALRGPLSQQQNVLLLCLVTCLNETALFQWVPIPNALGAQSGISHTSRAANCHQYSSFISANHKRGCEMIVLVRCILCHVVDMTLDAPKISCWMHHI